MSIEPGTFARLTYRRRPTVGMRIGARSWVLLSEGRSDYYYADDTYVSDVQPLRLAEPGQVILDLTRDQVDVLEAVANFAWQHGYMKSPTFERIIGDARAQLPALDPEPRWTVNDDGLLCDHGRIVKLSGIPFICAILNAVEDQP